MKSHALAALMLVSPSLLHAGPDTEVAEAALRSLDQAYVEAWKRDGTLAQKEALLPLFTGNAVIMPGGGAEPRQGLQALENFWFPEGAPPTNVRTFEHEIQGLEVSGDLGVVHGRFRLDFEYDGKEFSQVGNFLISASRQDAGEWRIQQMIWNNRTLP